MNETLANWARTRAINAQKDVRACEMKLWNYRGNDRSRIMALEMELRQAQVDAGYAEHDRVLWSTVAADLPLTPIE
jgi:hypothetical protein